jgi:hypothetical protein
MTLEGIVCTQSGSSDVMELKPSQDRGLRDEIAGELVAWTKKSTRSASTNQIDNPGTLCDLQEKAAAGAVAATSQAL